MGGHMLGDTQHEDFFHVNGHQRASATEVALINQREIMIWPIDIRQPLSSALPVWHHGYMNRATMVADGGHTCGPTA